jgi:hypothetical protein
MDDIVALEAGDYRKIPSVFSVFVVPKSKQKLAAAKALSQALLTMSFQAICLADIEMRQRTSLEWSIDWNKFRIDDFIDSRMSQEEIRAIVIFSSFHPNGYIRENAAKMLRYHAFSLPFLVLRQTDWVKEVRQSAAKSFCERLQEASNSEILASVPYYEKIRWRTHFEKTSISEFFEETILQRKYEHLLKIGLASPDHIIRRYCLRVLLNSPNDETPTLVNRLTLEYDPFQRRTIFEALCQSNLDIEPIAELFLKDKFPQNRILALQHLAEVNLNQALHHAKAMMLDKNASVRNQARALLSKNCCHDPFASIYHEHLNHLPIVAILGLGEVGSPSDSAIIEPFLKSPVIAEVRAAMISLMRLDPMKYRSVLFALLAQDSLAIASTASRLIKKYAVYDFDRLYDIYQQSPFESTKLKCAKLLFCAPKWQRLIFILQLLDSELDSIGLLCQRTITRWIDSYNRSFIMPTAEQKIAVQSLLSAHISHLNEFQRKELLFVVK